MSWEACTACRQSTRGALSYFYVNTYQGKTLIHRRLRLCGGCEASIMGSALSVADIRTSDGVWWSRDIWTGLDPAAVAGMDAAPSASDSTLSQGTASRRLRPK